MIRQSAWDRYRGQALTPGVDTTSEADIAAFVRAGVGTSYHPSGTCRMGVDDGAVVDREGRVGAARRTRVVDASIMPRIVSTNLSAGSMMIAEKICDRIRNKAALPPSNAPFFFSAGAESTGAVTSARGGRNEANSAL